MGLRDIKARARSDLHQQMRVRGFYYATAVSEPVECHVRVHTKFVLLGDQKGTSLNSAQNEDVAPRLIFWRAEVEPVRNSVVIIPAGDTGTGEPEGYRVSVNLPPDGLTLTARVSELTQAQIAEFTLPEGL